MRFTDELWQSTLPVYEEILRLPFINELTDGTLSRERFVFYMKQDALYLQDFSRSLAITGSRFPEPEHAQVFMGFAHGVFAVERQLHETYFRDFNVALDVERAPACFAYTQFLLATAATATHEEAAAALLPCFWIYRDVGNEIVSRSRDNVASNPYARWIETYSGEDYDESVTRAIDIVESLGLAASESMKQAMQRAFEKSARLEWMFWDSAYRMEAWPPTPASFER
jgi:thiaminase/transcriptional activator TenA